MDLLKNENIKLDLRTNIPDFLDIKQLPSNINIIKKHLTNKELQDYYNKADLIILPSVDEGFGMVGLEAMCLKNLFYNRECGDERYNQKIHKKF